MPSRRHTIQLSANRDTVEASENRYYDGTYYLIIAPGSMDTYQYVAKIQGRSSSIEVPLECFDILVRGYIAARRQETRDRDIADPANQQFMPPPTTT